MRRIIKIFSIFLVLFLISLTFCANISYRERVSQNDVNPFYIKAVLDIDGNNAPSGVYLVVLEGGDFCKTQKIVLLK